MKKILSLAAFVLMATSAMAQSAKADLKMQEGKFTEAIPVIDAEIAKVQADEKAASDKAQAKGKPFDASKFNAKFAGLYNQNAKCWAQLFTPELMKAAGSQPLDTTLFVTSLDHMVDYANLSYKYDNIPNAKGKVAGKFNADNYQTVSSCLDYFFYAGYFLSTTDKARAAEYFQKHIDLPKSPIFAGKTDSIVNAKKDNYDQAAFFACILNYELERYDKVLEAVKGGIPEGENAHDLYLMKAESALKVSGDSAQYVAVLKEAVANLADNSRFCETLLAYYYERSDAQGAHSVVDELIAKKGDSATPHYMKGCVYMNIEHNYAKARECFARALAIDPEEPNANGNMGFAYINEARERRLNGDFPMLDRKVVTGDVATAKYTKQLEEYRAYYRDAQKYMEKYRELQPERSKTWASALQQIYSNLGMDAEAQQMDDIMTSNAQNR